MEAILPYALGLAVFGIFVIIMIIKEKRASSRPPDHPCQQIQPCRCKSQPPDLPHRCTNTSDKAGLQKKS